MTHPFLDFTGPTGMAHRGGAGEAPENSVSAFRNAVSLGYRYIETDVRATADGVPVVFHDETLERVTDRSGRIRDMTFAEVRKARIGGTDPVQSLTEMLEQFPDTRFNIDIKEDNAVDPVLEVLTMPGVLDRVCIAAFSWGRLRAVRAQFGARVCTALAPQEVAALVSVSSMGRLAVRAPAVLPRGPACVEVPRRTGRIPVVTTRFVRAAHDRGWPVFVWTIDEGPEMDELLDLGADGIITDQPTVLCQVLEKRKRDFPAQT